MAKGVRVVISRAGLRALMLNSDLVTPRAEAIADACNSESSWGGYASAASNQSRIRARAHVWSYASQDGTGTTERANRMVRNLDSGG
jgi:hypothetical protein